MITPQTRAALAPVFARIARAYEADREKRVWDRFFSHAVHAYEERVFHPEYLDERFPPPRPVRRLTLVK